MAFHILILFLKKDDFFQKRFFTCFELFSKSLKNTGNFIFTDAKGNIKKMMRENEKVTD